MTDTTTAQYRSPFVRDCLVDRDTAITHALARTALESNIRGADKITEWADHQKREAAREEWMREVIVTNEIEDDDEYLEWHDTHMERAIALLNTPRTADPIIGDDGIYGAARADAATHGTMIEASA